MGRVTFQDDEVAARANRDFAPAWKNLQPGYRVEHLEGDRFEQIRRIPSGQASDNVATLFCTPAGEIAHIVPGHSKPQDYVREMEFALSVIRAAKDAGDPREVVRKMHRERLGALPKEAGEMGRRVLEKAHRRMIEKPLEAATEMKSLDEFALEGHPVERKMRAFQEKLRRAVEERMKEGRVEEIEALIDRLIRAIEE